MFPRVKEDNLLSKTKERWAITRSPPLNHYPTVEYKSSKMKKLTLLIAILLMAQAARGQSHPTEIVEIHSSVFNDVRKLKVSLPLDYNDYPNRKYFVAYLFDAQSDHYFNHVKASIDYLRADGWISPLILVGIESGNRRYEFTPKNQTEQPLKNYRKEEKIGGADVFAKHLKEEVFPTIQKKYRCNSYNIGIGHSLGGTFVTYSLMKFPELFNAAIAISPNYHYDDEQVVKLFDVMTTSPTRLNKFLYIGYGKGDTYEELFKPGTVKMEGLLTKKNIAGLKWEVKSLDNDSHGTTPLEGIFKGLLALNKELSSSATQVEAFYKDMERPFIDKIKEYYRSQSRWSGVQLPTVWDINRIGYNCYYAGKNKEAVETFAWALSLYPDDINLYDSMGEIQQGIGNKKEALYFYLKGLDVVEQQKSKLSMEIFERLRDGFKDRIKSVDN